MSSIAPIQSSVTTTASTTESAPVTGTQTGAAGAEGGLPLYLKLDGSNASAAAVLGIRLPGDDGDIAALIGEASLNLEKSIDQSRKNRIIAGTAGLAAALSQSNLQAVYDEWRNRQSTLNDGKSTQSTIDGRLEPLQSTLDARNATIDGYRGDISDLQNALKDPNLTPSERTALETQLASAKDGLSSALAARRQTDIAIANLRIDGLGMQIDDLQAQLSRAEPGSSEASSIQDQIDALTSEKQQAEGALAGFLSGPQDDATLTAFSQSNLAALQADIAALAVRVGGYQKAFDDQSALLDQTTGLTIAAAARAMSEFNSQQEADGTQDALRDSAIDRAFQLIAAQDRSVSATQADIFRVRDEHGQDIADSADADRVSKAAADLVRLLGDLLATLSGLADTQLSSAEIAAAVTAGPGGTRSRLDL